MPLTIGKLPININTGHYIFNNKNKGVIMETETNVNIDEIGYIAKTLDFELTIFERMKIKKRSLKKISGAIVFYLTTMLLFSFCL